MSRSAIKSIIFVLMSFQAVTTGTGTAQERPGLNNAVQNAANSLFVTGVVLDPTDATIAGAKVTLQSKGNEDRSTVTDAIGVFRFDGVSSGSYELQVQHEGFKPAKSRLKLATRPL